MIKKILAATVVCAGTIIAIPAFAISVTESTDFPNSSGFPGFDLGTLDLGANTVSGALSSACVSGDCNMQDDEADPQDSFVIHVGTGNQIDSLFVSTSNVSGPDGFSASFSMRDPSNHTVAANYSLPLGSMSANLVLSPIGPGEYSLSMFGQTATSDGPYSLDYSIAMNISAVPEPETYALILAGLGLVGFAVRRRQKIKA